MTPDLPMTTPVVEVSDAEVVAFVQRYVDEHALSTEPVTLSTPLADAGLDSLATAELLLSARAELVAAGRLDPDSTLLDMPILVTVADLGGLIRALGS